MKLGESNRLNPTDQRLASSQVDVGVSSADDYSHAENKPSREKNCNTDKSNAHKLACLEIDQSSTNCLDSTADERFANLNIAESVVEMNAAWKPAIHHRFLTKMKSVKRDPISAVLLFNLARA
ncbi:hypothetical protein FBUS_06070 [Fasciolopsis buskii]|uniref:Uncharacterized protein n=1 Tax=Fasciolopsis buskii TaxID=27845 RepID=A0A8E0VHS5_9TREM|nr:hypothetical protein FBUS_06070 [Fasciolopsis buski]